MLKFWKWWIDNDMEKRHGLETKITHVNAVTKFNRDMRPRYTKCRNTIEETMAKAPKENQKFFKERYADLGSALDPVKETQMLIEAINKDVPNLLEAVGINSK